MTGPVKGPINVYQQSSLIYEDIKILGLPVGSSKFISYKLNHCLANISAAKFRMFKSSPETQTVVQAYCHRELDKSPFHAGSGADAMSNLMDKLKLPPSDPLIWKSDFSEGANALSHCTFKQSTDQPEILEYSWDIMQLGSVDNGMHVYTSQDFASEK